MKISKIKTKKILKSKSKSWFWFEITI